MPARDGVPAPDHIEVRGARVHNLKGVDVDIPLNELVGVAGVSGSGKSSLALGVLYAEGSRRYLESLSTYTRRRMTQASHAAVDDVRYVPAALALHQRPAVPGVRSTFGTMSELLNSLRLLFSRVASHRCPHCGAYAPPSMAVATDQPITCPACGEKFFGPGAEDLAFNSTGACPTCEGTGVVRTVNEASLVPDESISIDDGAVLPWGSLMWDLMKQVCGAMGVRTNVPFSELTPEERDIVFHGPAVKKHILYHPKKGDDFAELDFTYFNAVYTVENALAKVKDEKGLKRVSRFLTEGACPDCGGTRLSEAARAPRVAGIGLADATAMTLGELVAWVAAVPAGLPDDVRPMAESICESFQHTARRLLDLGLSYLSLDRAAATLSTGERQRVQLARAVRNRTTGVLYVLDEPSIGLHPANVDGLLGVMRDLHDARILAEADHLIELGPGAGADGGRVICQGSVTEVAADPASRVGGFLTGEKDVLSRPRAGAEEMFDLGTISMETEALHTVRPLHVEVPRGRLVVVTGVSGSGKTTLVLETLVPALAAAAAGEALPAHVRWVDAEGVRRANLIDATPIGINVRSTVATWPPTRASTTSCGAPTPAPTRRVPPATRPGTSRTTPGACAAPPATARGRYRSTCSSFRTWTSPARTAAARATPRRRTPCTALARASRRTRASRSRSSWRSPWMRRSTHALTCGALPRDCRCCTTWGWGTSRSARPHRRSRAARPSASSSRARWVAHRTTPSSSSTSPRSACTRSTCRRCSRCSSGSWRRAPPSS